MIRKIITFTICIVITLLSLIYTPHIINAKNIDNIRAAETTGESIDIKENVPGDINGDGKVNNKDFTRLFQYMAGWKVDVNTLTFDTNGDGKVNNKDVTRLFQYLADWSVELYVCTHTHNIVAESEVDATCITDGYTKYECDGCLHNYIGDYVYALGHMYVEWYDEVLPSCTSEGLQYSNCIYCGKENTRSVEKIDHYYLLLEENESTIKYECNYCGDIKEVDVSNEDIKVDSNEQLLDQKNDFSFVVTTDKGIEYIYENLKIFNIYFENTEYEDQEGVSHPFIVKPLSNVIELANEYANEEIKNAYVIIPEQEYEEGMTYKVETNDNVKFADYVGNEISFSIEENEQANIIFQDNVKFLKLLEENNPGYYPYSLQMGDEESEKLYLTINKIDDIEIGDILLIGDVISVEEYIEGIEEVYFGKVEERYINEKNQFICVLSCPELEEVFELFDVFVEKDINLEEYPELEETLEEESLMYLYNSEDFAEFVASSDYAVQTYASERNAVASPLTKANFMDKIKIEKPKVNISGTKATITFKGSFINKIENKKGTEIGTFSINFSISLELELTAEASIKIGWFRLKQLDIRIIQKDKISIDFDIEFNIDYELNDDNENYYYHKKYKKIHVYGCTYQKMTDVDNIVYINGSELHEYAEKDGFTTCLKCQPIDKLNRTSFVINTHISMGGNTPYTIHCCDCWHVEHQMLPVNKEFFKGSFEQLKNKYTEAGIKFEVCSWCQPDKKEKQDFEEELKKAYEYADWGDKVKEIKEWAKSSKGSEYKDSTGIKLGGYSYTIWGITFNIDLKLTLSFQFEAKLQYHYEQSHENIYGIRKQSEGLVTYKQNKQNESYSSLELSGGMDFKVGVQIDGYLSVVGLSRWVRLGFYIEVGPYIEIDGIIKLTEVEDENNYAAAKLSTGLYLEIAGYYKIFSYDGIYTILDTKLPFVTLGYDRAYYSYTDGLNKISINGNVKLDELLSVKYYDINIGDSVDELLSFNSNLYSVNVTFKNGTYCNVINGEIVINEDAPCKFKDIITIEVKGNTKWNKYKKDSAIIYLDMRTIEINYQKDGEHDYIDVEINDSTCTQDGYKIYYCRICNPNKMIKEIIPAGHKIIIDEFVLPTCNKMGYTEGSHCSLCNTIFLEQQEIPMIPHTEEILPAVEATCTLTGLTEGIKCSKCNEVLQEQIIIPISDHIYELKVIEPTCQQNGYQYEECTNCHFIVQENIIETIDHNYVNNKCTMCGKEKEQSQVSLVPYEENGKTYINFGRYPQTVVTDTNLINELDKITTTNSLGYIEYNGEEYKKQVADPYNSDSIFQNGNEVLDGETYYFLVEPIKWRVLETSNGSYKLLSEYLLDTQQFYTSWHDRTLNGQTIYANNYEYSNIRAWLNGYNGTSYNVEDYTNKGFIDIAFTEEEKAIIKTTLVDNSASSTGDSTNKYACDNTYDKIYLLSYKEATNTSYGFDSDYSEYDPERRAQVTDYALARYCWMSTSTDYYRNGAWRLRSPIYSYSDCARYVNYYGYIDGSVVDYFNFGVRAALEINLTNNPHNHNYTTKVVNPTCTEQGYTLHTCSVCNDTYKDTYVDALGHKETDWIIDENSTCTKEGTKHTECERCKETIQTASIPTIDHNYVNNKCTMCGKEKEPIQVSLKPYEENGKTYINFGRYPQTVVTDTNLINELDKITTTNSLGYIEYNGEEYKKQVADPFYSDYTFKNGNTIQYGATYYFLVEPIKWRVLETTSGGYKLLSEYLLDAQHFYTSSSSRTLNGETIYANNYEYSNIRAWLNGYNGTSYNVEDYTNKGFIGIAFTEEEKAIIKTTLVDNSLASTKDSSNIYICNNTNDKIYLLSRQEATNTTYGFDSDYNEYDPERRAQVTDYALARGCWMSTSTDYYRNGAWWLRSPDYNDSFNARYVDFYGYVDDYSVNGYRHGVRAALEINLTI